MLVYLSITASLIQHTKYDSNLQSAEYKNTDSMNHSIMSTETVSRMPQMSEQAVSRIHELVEAASGPRKSNVVTKMDPSTRMSSNRRQSSEPCESEGPITLSEECQTVQPTHSTTGIDETPFPYPLPCSDVTFSYYLNPIPPLHLLDDVTTFTDLTPPILLSPLPSLDDMKTLNLHYFHA
jgi:hypothetical protein